MRCTTRARAEKKPSSRGAALPQSTEAIGVAIVGGGMVVSVGGSVDVGAGVAVALGGSVDVAVAEGSEVEVGVEVAALVAVVVTDSNVVKFFFLTIYFGGSKTVP